MNWYIGLLYALFIFEAHALKCLKCSSTSPNSLCREGFKKHFQKHSESCYGKSYGSNRITPYCYTNATVDGKGKPLFQRGCTFDEKICEKDDPYREFCNVCNKSYCNNEFVRLKKEMEDYLTEMYLFRKKNIKFLKERNQNKTTIIINTTTTESHPTGTSSKDVTTESVDLFTSNSNNIENYKTTETVSLPSIDETTAVTLEELTTYNIGTVTVNEEYTTTTTYFDITTISAIFTTFNAVPESPTDAVTSTKESTMLDEEINDISTTEFNEYSKTTLPNFYEIFTNKTENIAPLPDIDIRFGDETKENTTQPENAIETTVTYQPTVNDTTTVTTETDTPTTNDEGTENYPETTVTYQPTINDTTTTTTETVTSTTNEEGTENYPETTVTYQTTLNDTTTAVTETVTTITNMSDEEGTENGIEKTVTYQPTVNDTTTVTTETVTPTTNEENTENYTETTVTYQLTVNDTTTATTETVTTTNVPNEEVTENATETTVNDTTTAITETVTITTNLPSETTVKYQPIVNDTTTVTTETDTPTTMNLFNEEASNMTKIVPSKTSTTGNDEEITTTELDIFGSTTAPTFTTTFFEDYDEFIAKNGTVEFEPVEGSGEVETV